MGREKQDRKTGSSQNPHAYCDREERACLVDHLGELITAKEETTWPDVPR